MWFWKKKEKVYDLGIWEPCGYNNCIWYKRLGFRKDDFTVTLPYSPKCLICSRYTGKLDLYLDSIEYYKEER